MHHQQTESGSRLQLQPTATIKQIKHHEKTRVHLFMCVHLCTNKPLDLGVRRFCVGVLPTTREEKNQTILQEWNHAFKRLRPSTWVRELERLCEVFYTIWQSVSQHGALSRVKYLAALPWKQANWMFRVLAGFPTSSGFLVLQLINKPSSVTASATFTGVN